MPIAKPLYKLLLAVLLLVGLGMFAGKQGQHFSLAPADASSIALSASGEEKSVSEKFPYRLDAVRQHSTPPVLARCEGGSGQGTFDRDPGYLAQICFAIETCAKAALKQRLIALLEHYKFQQQLSLYPKHSFW